MALLTHRDPLVVGTALASWIEDRTGARDVRVVNAEHPSTGWSSETVLVDLAWSGDGHEHDERTHEFVVRIAPPMVGTFRDYDLAQQTVAQLAAASAGVAIASPELVSDDRWLGTQFVVMPRVRGHIIGDVAVNDSWLLSLTEGERAQVHQAFVAAVAATHRADLAAAAGVPERDNDAELDFWADYLDWSSGGVPVPALVDALAWCRAHRPAVASGPVLLWGDVRLGNVIFGDDLVPRAVLDWDMASIGAPEHDVAWFTTLESTMRSMLGRHLDGFPDREGTIAQYESLSGRTLRDMEWYEILALTRSTAILARIGYLHRDAGLPSPMPLEDNPLLDLLAAHRVGRHFLIGGTMHFGLRFDFRNPEIAGTTMADRFAAALDIAEWADQLGCVNIAVSEHHGSADGYLPSPIPMLAAMAARTTRVRFLIAALIAPFHDPLRLAEDMVVLDNLSQGRVDVIVAGGYVHEEFAMFDVPMNERAKRVTKAVTTLKAAFTGQPFEYEDRTVHITPAPFRPGGPAIFLGGSTEPAARRAARIADGFIPSVPEVWDFYRDEVQKLGRPDPGPSPIGANRVVALAEDPEKGWEQMAPFFLHETNAYGTWQAQDDIAAPYHSVADVDQLRATDQYRVLTPEQFVEEQRAAPFPFAMFHPLCGGMPIELAWSSLRLFEREVLPAFG